MTYVLVNTDPFTRLAHAFPYQGQTPKREAKRLWDNFFRIYGIPQHLHSDQRANFESELIAELLILSGVDKSHNSPYHPMTKWQSTVYTIVAAPYISTGSMIRTSMSVLFITICWFKSTSCQWMKPCLLLV